MTVFESNDSAGPPICPKCNLGPESCDFCHGLDEADFEAICDCGLYDFGRHLISCEVTHEALA